MISTPSRSSGRRQTRRHDPRHEVWVGVATEGTERAARVDAILDALRADGHELVEATPQPDDALLDVHDRELLEFLRDGGRRAGRQGRTPTWSARTAWCRTCSRRRR